MEEINTVNIILVGSNPMPCYVQAAYLMEPGRDEDELDSLPVPDLQVLLYTEETRKFKDNLKHALCKRYALQQDENGELKKQNAEAYQVRKSMKRKIETWEDRTLPIENNYTFYQNVRINELILKDVSNPMTIMKDLERLSPCLENVRKVILNNTGGTKTMATYVTLWLQQKTCHCSLTECYVDDKRKRLCCYTRKETGNIEFAMYPGAGSLTDTVILKIPEVARLHGYGGYGSKEPYFAANEERRNAVRNFAGNIFDINGAGIHSDHGEESDSYYERYAKLLSRYCYLQDKELRKYFKGLCVDDAEYLFDDNLAGTTGLGEAIKEKEPLLYRNSTDLADDLNRILHPAENANDRMREPGGERPADDSRLLLEKDSLRLLKGEWMEAYVYIAVKEAISRIEKENVDLAWSVVIDEGHGANDPKNFELDVVACVGYELKIFSITTDATPGKGKLKYFEALFRGEIISGSHSQVIAVNLIDKDDREMTRIRDDLQSFGSTNYRQARVWGKQDVCNYEQLVDEIERILKME